MVINLDFGTSNDLMFYVIDDLRRNGYRLEYFDNLAQAVGAFAGLDGSGRTMPTLGVQRGNAGLDLVHRVNGENVLVQDFKNKNLSETMDVVRPVLEEIGGYLRDEIGIGRTYSHAFFDRVGKSVSVVVPLGNEDGFDSSYCEGKRLKTVSGFGFDSINELFVSGYGWVKYLDIYEDVRSGSNEYCENGVLCVEGVNVNYCLDKNYTGVDGQMDISVHDFERMLEDVNKEYSLMVFDKRFGNGYIVDSFDTERDAVRAWYELPAELSAHVEQRGGYSYQQVIFNGLTDDFAEISYEQAAKIYGFDNKGLASVLNDANQRSAETRTGGFVAVEREIGQ